MKNLISYNLLVFLLCSLISFSLAYKINYKLAPHTRKGPLQELILIANDNCYHIHHFMWMTILVICILIGKYINELMLMVIIGLWLGASLENFLFKDWYIIKNNCHKNKLIKLLQNTTDINPEFN